MRALLLLMIVTAPVACTQGPVGARGDEGPPGPTGAAGVSGVAGPAGLGPSPFAPVPQAGLVAHYRGEGIDLSGNSYHLTATGVGLVPDRFGQPDVAGLFDGDGDEHHLEGNFPSGANPVPQGASPRTISIWVRARSHSAAGPLLNLGTQNTANRFGTLLVNCTDYFVGENRDIPGAVPLCDNEWHHVAVTYDGTQVRSYVDGELSGVADYELDTIGTQLSVGRSTRPDGTSYETFIGELDDARIYNRALRRDELLSLFHEGGYLPPWWPDAR
jgi:hypothetical protein